MGTIFGLLGALGTFAVNLLRFVMDENMRRQGRTEASLDRANEESRRAKERQKIDSAVRALTSDQLESELRGGTDAKP